MDRIVLLEERKKELLEKSRNIRDFISGFLDEMSFVETDAFSFSRGDLFENSGSYGEGVVTGYAAVDGIPVCVAAQNYDVNKGGLNKAQADKILKCQLQAEKTGAVMISVIDTSGAQVGEGITALEGYAQIIAQANKMYGSVTQVAIIKGSCLGAMSYFAALNDFVIMLDGSVASTGSPVVIAAASGSTLSAKDLCGAEVQLKKTGFSAVTVKDINELGAVLKLLLNHLSPEEEFSPESELNSVCEELNSGYSIKAVSENVFDKGTFIEISKGYAPEIVCGIAKIGGVTAGALLCADNKEGAYITSFAAKKAARFIRLCDRYNLPLISFVNTAGVAGDAASEQSPVINDVANLFSAVNDYEGAKISVICGKAVGAGYCALASKSIGFDNCLAWANASVTPLNESASAIIEYSDEIKNSVDPEKTRGLIEKRYADIQADPFNAAKAGSIDNIIEPALTRQYIISMLMVLI